MRVLVVDYGKGNVRSIVKGLEQAGADVIFSDSSALLSTAGAVVLPGVGAFADAAAYMEQSGQMQALRDFIQTGKAFLGICLGAQLMLEWGAEGLAHVQSEIVPDSDWIRGLGVVAGHCCRLADQDSEGRHYKIPHVGWNQVEATLQGRALAEPLFSGIEDKSNFYFTHSYQTVPTHAESILAVVTHANTFPAVIRAENAFGVQFHPEKSSRKGLIVLENFIHFAEAC